MRLCRIAVVVAAAALAGCTSGHADPLPSRPPASPAPHVSDVAAVFITALGGRSEVGPGRTYVLDSTVCSQALRQRACPPVPIPRSVQDEVVAALGSHVIFTAHPPTRLSPGAQIVVTLGAPAIEGDRATVSVETNCGPLCGLGQILVLTRRGDGWVRTGTTGSSWIS